MTPSAHILIADDSVIFLNVFVLLLENAGYRVTSVTDGRQALEALRSGSFDLAILDNGMPNLDGIGALTELRAFLPQLPVIVCTGSVTQTQAAEYRALGIADLLYKPVDPRILREKISRILASRSPSAPAPVQPVANKATLVTNSHLPSPLIAGPSRMAVKLKADLTRLRDFRSVAILEGLQGSGRFELALCAAPVANNYSLACHANELDAALLEKLIQSAHHHQHPLFLVILDADRLTPAIQTALEDLVRGRIEKHAEVSKRLRMVLCTQTSLCDMHFNEYLLMRAMACTQRIPDFSRRQEDWVDIAKAILHRASSGKEEFGSAALKWIELQPWPGDYMQLHRTIELARRQARLTSIISAMQLQTAAANEPQCTEPLFHDLLFHVHSGEE
ncbi:MAG TPA: response regulator [Rariglobus sp.]|jgi:two-component system response regulator HydG|nr:response regulator [Rariglobus sp.]